jgi:hypothetical protein
VTDDIRGFPVALHDRCLNCGSSTSFAGAGRLLCDGCETSRGRIGKDLRARLERHIQKFGWPDGYLILRINKVHKPGSVGVDAATALKPKRKSRKAKRPMKMNDLFPSKYLRAADLAGKPRVVTIEKVTHEDFKDDGVAVKKTVIHFRKNGTATAPVVVNKTNWKMLVAITGSDDDDNWAGHRIELRSEKVNSPGGRIVDSIRVHEAPAPKKAKAADIACNDEVGF